MQLTTGAGPDESPSAARDGSVSFVNSRWRNTLDLHSLHGGPARTLLTHAPFLRAPVFAPDSRSIAFTRGEVDGSWHVWTVPADGSTPRRLTSSEGGEIYPRYTPDGKAVLYHNWAAPRRIWRVPTDGGTPQLVSRSPDGESYADVSPDGRSIAFVRAEAQSERVYVAAIDGVPHPMDPRDHVGRSGC